MTKGNGLIIGQIRCMLSSLCERARAAAAAAASCADRAERYASRVYRADVVWPAVRPWVGMMGWWWWPMCVNDVHE